MIHSLAGGVIREKKYFDFAKVKLETGELYWYISTIKTLKPGDMVVVPYGNEEAKAFVIRIDKHISEQVSPIPVKRAKTILKICEE